MSKRPNTYFDSRRFADDLNRTLAARHLNLREAVKAIGQPRLSIGTLSRLTRELNTPDVPTLLRLCNWMNTEPQAYQRSEKFTALKILWHSNSPETSSGYANQTALFTPRLKALGHEVTISAYYGIEGHRRLNSDGIYELPRAMHLYGNDIIRAHYDYVRLNGRQDLDTIVISLCDAFVLNPDVWRTMNWAAWLPIDSAPIFPQNISPIKACRWPIAMSHFGEEQLKRAGFEPLYIPHGVDTNIFKPIDRAAARAEFAKFTKYPIDDDTFIVMSVGANIGVPGRKNFSGMIEAFAAFHAEYPNSVFYIHTEPAGLIQGENLRAHTDLYGVSEHVCTPPTYEMLTGLIDQPRINQFYNAADVFMLLSRGEGFGIPLIEAQSAGCPVITTDFSASAELGEVGWKIPYMIYSFAPGAPQAIASTVGAQLALKNAYELKVNGKLQEQRDRARAFALQYDVDKVFEAYWKPVLAKIERDLALMRPFTQENGKLTREASKV